MIPTWKQKLLCTGCAAVLAAGLIPMSAWGGADGVEPESATTFAAETPTNDTGVNSDGAQNDGETQPSDDVQASGTNTPTDGDQNGIGENGDSSAVENQGEEGNQGNGNDGQGEDDSSDTGTLTDVDGQNQGDSTNSEDDSVSESQSTPNNNVANEDGNKVDAENNSSVSDDPMVDNQQVNYAEVEITSAGTMTMWPNEGTVLTSPDGEPFELNNAAREFFDTNPFGDYLVSVVSSDPSVITVTRDNEADYIENAYLLESKKPGTATVTLTLKDKEPVSCKITVKSAADADLSKLKFQTKNITLKVGESNFSGFYGYQWLGEEAEEAVGYNYAFASSDDSILDCWVNDGSFIAALRPGVVTLSLYYFNPETEEYTLTDTATVTIGSPDTLAGSSPSSVISGNIMNSNDEITEIVKNNNLSLNVSITDANSMKEGVKKSYLLIKDAFAEENSRVIPVEISLVDQNGKAYVNELGDEYPYTVRLKIEGELSELDPDTIMVYYLGEDGNPVDVTSWVEDGYLYIMTTHFSPYAITGKVKTTTSATTAPVTQASSNNATAKKQTVTATAGETLPQAGDESTDVVPVVALSTAAAAAAIALARRRMQE